MNNTLDYRIFAFGKAGSKIVRALLDDKFPRERIFYFDTAMGDFDSQSLSNRYLVAPNTIGTIGLNGNVQKGREAFQHERDLFTRLTREDSIYIIVGGLGGGTFTGVGLALAESLAQRGKRFVLVTFMPGKHEGKKKLEIAIDGLRFGNHYTDKVVLLTNTQRDVLFKQEGEIAFAKVDNQAVVVIRELITNTGALVLQSTDLLEERMHDAIQRATAYMHGSNLYLAHKDQHLIIAQTHDALVEAINCRPEVTHQISHRKFEELVAHIYARAGYRTELTPPTRDHGVDIKAWMTAPLRGDEFLTILQAKQMRKDRVGEKDIRELVGTKKIQRADRAGLVTTVGFSKDAIKIANSEKIDLIKFYDLVQEAKAVQTSALINEGKEDYSKYSRSPT